jgi:hypothetical protein
MVENGQFGPLFLQGGIGQDPAAETVAERKRASLSQAADAYLAWCFERATPPHVGELATRLGIDPQGTVNPIWVNLAANQIQTTQSHDYGSTYGAAPFEVVTGSFVISGETIPGFAAGRANSVPMARYNSAAGRICLAYYGRNGSTYEIFYTYKPGCTSCNSGGWPTTPVQLTTSSNADNNYFNAALDFNKTTGDLIVPYYRSYATTDGFGNKTYYYDEYAASITASGSLLQTITLSPSSSNPNLQNVFPGFLGDYQDVWDDLYASEQVVSAWIGVRINGSTSDNGDDCVTPVSY